MNGRLAIIAGGTGGLGTAIGQHLLAQGASLALLYAPFEADRLPALLKASYGREDGQPVQNVQAYSCDITSDKSVEEAMAAIAREQVGRDGGKVLPSILINAAGYVSLNDLESTPTAEITKHLHINLLGPILLCQAFARMYFAHREKLKDAMPPGRIVNIASQAAHVALAQHGAYCASKAGLVGVTRSMASEWAGRGITANTVSPGPVMTELGKKAWGAEDVRDKYLAEVPTSIFAEPEEVASTVLFLCTDAARNINGADIRLDGGFTSR